MADTKIFIFDLDGTLTTSKQDMSPEMGYTLGQLLAKARVAVMSGASLRQFETQFLPALPKDANLSNLYLFPTNAAQCFVYKDGEWKPEYKEEFTPEERSHILESLQDAMVETRFKWPTQLWGDQIEDRGAQITFSALGQKAPIEEKKKWDPTREKRRPLYESLLRRLPEFSVGLNATTSIDITRKGINKAHGVQKLAEISGVPISNMIYVGDALFEGGNDSIVIPTGVATHEVKGPEDTKEFIESILPA